MNFSWRWSVPVIALSLLVADYAYFWALRHPDALVSIVMSLRRASTLVAFAGGFVVFSGGERVCANFRRWIGILIGISADDLRATEALNPELKVEGFRVSGLEQIPRSAALHQSRQCPNAEFFSPTVSMTRTLAMGSVHVAASLDDAFVVGGDDGQADAGGVI